MSSHKRFLSFPAMLACTSIALSACTAQALQASEDNELRVVTTTGILADLVRNVAGPDVHLSQIVPDGADPHSYEPSLRSIRDIAYADLAFTNYLLLEEHAIIRTLDANLPSTALSVSIAEEAAKDGATILPLVEDRALDTAWLGMRVAGRGQTYGATRSSEVDLSATTVEGPGQASSYLTTTFGTPQIAFSSSDGFDEGDGYAADTMTLPADAHTHMSWAFTQPGVYRVTFRGALRVSEGARPIPMKAGTAVFAVGVDPQKVAAEEGRVVFAAGHGDLSVDIDAGMVTLMVDQPSDGSDSPLLDAVAPESTSVPGLLGLDLDKVVIDVPTRTLTEVPGTAGFRFLGQPGDPLYLLPQAVLGKHVHGEIDPHLWHDVHNAAAYVRVIRDRLIEVDPQGAEGYRQRASAYLKTLEDIDAKVAATIDTIPEDSRHLVTTHDAYAYLANAYGLSVAGFVAPNPAVEPSIADRRKLAATIEDLTIGAVFLEPQLANRRSTLTTVAQESGVQVCPLYGDTFDHEVHTYVDMMMANANSLARCLGGSPSQ
ncbi:anchored repeat ABC transporter, substrate-binding protein [Schaalia canis]|nr:anchored repeat ABC transporter, substrate-binding protein [Schaalia canis]